MDNSTTTDKTLGSTLVSQQSVPELGRNAETHRLEERRTSSLDQHWAVPKQKRSSDSTDSQSDSDRNQMGESTQDVYDGTFMVFIMA